MIKQDMNAIEALNYVLKKRLIKPNDGFLKQISRLDNNLRKKKTTLTEHDRDKIFTTYSH